MECAAFPEGLGTWMYPAATVFEDQVLSVLDLRASHSWPGINRVFFNTLLSVVIGHGYLTCKSPDKQNRQRYQAHCGHDPAAREAVQSFNQNS